MKITPKDFFLWLGAMVAFYWSVVAFIFLIFNYIDYAFPDPLSYLPDPYSSGIPYQMASIVVMFPVYFGLFMLIRRDIARDPSRKEIWVRRWVLILTLFLAGATVAGDVIVLLTTFFSGDALTVTFLLKILIVFLVAAGVFMHFIADYWGYWDEQRKRELVVCGAVGVLMIGSIIAGFFIVGTPQHARLLRYDQQKISDLQGIQSQVVYYWQQKDTLPESLSDLTDSISGYSAPLDPQNNQPYEYRIIQAPYSFELCAEFNAAGDVQNGYVYPRYETITLPATKGVLENWQHDAGHICFERTIDPELYTLPAKQ